MNRPNPAAKRQLRVATLVVLTVLLLASWAAAAPQSLLGLALWQPRQASFYGYGAHVSEWVQATNASAFQDAGLAGSGISICIISSGFAGFGGAEIPVPITRSYRADATMGATNEGAYMAEVAVDMAPAATLTLVAYDTAASARSAVLWVAAQNFDVVISNLQVVDGPFDGTDTVSRAVASAAAAGTALWVQSSGDYAQRHWTGPWVDANSDSFLDFGSARGVSLTLAAQTYSFPLSWYQTAGAITAQDYDLCLYAGTGAAAPLVAQSSVSQNGNGPPSERLTVRVPLAGTYELRIKAVSINATLPDTFQLWSPVDLPGTVAVAPSSLTVPAMVPGVLTVGAIAGTMLGAVPPASADAIEAFSGRGPTLTGAMKPDMVGACRVTTSLEAVPAASMNTGVAAAHLGGAAALLLSEDAGRTPAALKALLYSLAVPLPSALLSPNNDYGRGKLALRLGLDTDPPTISVLYPLNSTTITERLPKVQARITDQGTGVDAASIRLRIDGVLKTLTGYNATSGMLTYQPTTNLSLAAHTLTIDASDRAGNPATTAVVNFRVALPSVEAGLHMFSLPYSYGPGLTPTVANFFGGASGLAVARWWPGDSTYHYYPDSYATFLPPDAIAPGAVVSNPPLGLAYFVRLDNDVLLDITGDPLTGADTYSIELTYGLRSPRGWNMIGCPFTSTVDWGSVRFITNGANQSLSQAIAAGVTEGILFGFQTTAGGGYYTFSPDPLAAVMEPFQGYWLHVFKNTTLVIPAPSVAVQAAAPAATPPAGEGAWRLQLVVSSGSRVDPCNYVGVSPDAAEGYSPLWSVCEPPAADTQLRAALVEKSWGERSGYFAQVIKPASGRQSWDLEVACAEPNAEVWVRWPQLNATVPAGSTLLLQDLDSGEEVYMRTSAGYSFTSGPSGGTRHLRLTLAQGNSGGLALTSVSAQAVSGGGVAFTYALSAPATVTAEVRNISGVLIKQFAASQTAGSKVELLVWNGRSDRGSKVPAGRYLVRITARSESGQTLQAIRPFEVML